MSTLLYCMGEESEAVLASTNITDDERKVHATVLSKLDGFFKVRHREHASTNRMESQPRLLSWSSTGLPRAVRMVI